MTEPVVSVIIVNLDGERWLGPCLEGLMAQRDIRPEIVLVDNGSADRSLEIVRRRFPAVRTLALGRNVGFAAGNNAGARIATGRYLAFLNNDTVPDPGWVSSLHTALEAHGSAGLVTSRIVFMHDPSVIDSAGDGLTRAGGAFKHAHGQAVGEGLVAREVFAACGAACMMPRALFERLGGFDEDFFAVYEDVDLSYRARLLGYGCRYVPDAVVAHAGSATLGRGSARAVFLGQRNLEWSYLKNTPWPLLVGSLPAHVAYVTAGALYYATRGMLGPFLAGKRAALAGIPVAWRKRREIQRRRRVSARQIRALMDRTWWAIKLREKRFDRLSAT